MDTPRRIRRRTMIAAGTAWAAPTVVLGAGAPAFAASASCSSTCPSIPFGAAPTANSWTNASQGTFDTTAVLAYRTSYSPWDGPEATCTNTSGGGQGGTLADVLLVEANPTALSPAPRITATRSLCLTSGYTYSFAFDWNAYGLNRRSISIQATLIRAGGVLLAQSPTRTVARAASGATHANQRGTEVFEYSPSVSETLDFTYTWSFGSTPALPTSTQCDREANDLAVTAPRITCRRS